jgi:hypothetical protein
MCSIRLILILSIFRNVGRFFFIFTKYFNVKNRWQRKETHFFSGKFNEMGLVQNCYWLEFSKCRTRVIKRFVFSWLDFFLNEIVSDLRSKQYSQFRLNMFKFYATWLAFAIYTKSVPRNRHGCINHWRKKIRVIEIIVIIHHYRCLFGDFNHNKIFWLSLIIREK